MEIDVLYDYIKTHPHRSGSEIRLAFPGVSGFSVSIALKVLYLDGRIERMEQEHDGIRYFIYRIAGAGNDEIS